MGVRSPGVVAVVGDAVGKIGDATAGDAHAPGPGFEGAAGGGDGAGQAREEGFHDQDRQALRDRVGVFVGEAAGTFPIVRVKHPRHAKGGEGEACEAAVADGLEDMNHIGGIMSCMLESVTEEAVG
jgi:hypothetical protein